jgi:hypothetical protein
MWRSLSGCRLGTHAETLFATQTGALRACAKVLVLTALLLPAASREIVITPDPSGKPVIEAALNDAGPGSVIRLRKGVYREFVTIAKPVSLVGDEGAVIDPSEAFRVKWQAAPEYGEGVFRAAADRAPATLFIDGTILAEVDPQRKETASEGTWYWKDLLAKGAPHTGFRYVRGLWLYQRDEHAVFVHLENHADPNTRSWTVVWKRDAIVSLSGTHDASLRGVTLAHGFNGAAITKDCERCAVLECKVGPWDKTGVGIQNGATSSLVESNEIFRGSYEDWTPQTVVHNGRIEVNRDWYEIWQVHKLAGLYDRVGVVLNKSGAGNRVHANRIHDTFDGIDVEEYPETLDATIDVQLDRGAEIWDNLIERTGDSGIEVGGGAIDLKIHHNTLRRTHGGLRYKLPRTGPVFIYRNLLIDGSPFNIWYSMDDSPAEGYVYHNTVVGGGYAALSYGGWEHYHDIGAPHWHYLNNLLVVQRGFFESHSPRIPINFTADYNVVQGEGHPYPGDTTRDSHSRYLSDVRLAPGFPPKPMPDSPAIDAGLDLSTYFHGKPLPGCEPGYFKGKAPDAGAFEIQ